MVAGGAQVAGVPRQGTEAVHPTVRPAWPGSFVQAGEHRLHVRRTPPPATRGQLVEPAVFVHGLAGSATHWTDLMGVLAPRLEGVAPDLPGFGWSPAPPTRDYSLAGHAGAVVALLETVAETEGRGPVHLFGNSLGGAVATRVAALRPDLVRTLVLVSPALPVRRARRTNLHLPALATPWLGEQLVTRLGGVAVEQRVRVAFALMYADPSAVPAERLAQAVEEARRRTSLEHDREALLHTLRGVIRDYLRRGPESLWQLAAQVRVPTLLVYGLRDRIVDPRTAQRAVRTFPRSRLVELPHTGHVAQMERPDLVGHFVLDHLRSPEQERGASPSAKEADDAAGDPGAEASNAEGTGGPEA